MSAYGRLVPGNIEGNDKDRIRKGGEEWLVPGKE